MYQSVPVCTLKELNLGSFENCHCYIVSNAQELYDLYIISPDSLWMGRKTTCLVESMPVCWYVLVHTVLYQREILVLTCTMLYWYVLVRTSIYHFS